jgi:hypothetical protein
MKNSSQAIPFGSDLGLASERETEPKSETTSVCPNRTDIGGIPKTVFFFVMGQDETTGGVQGGKSGTGGEHMEDREEMEEESTSNVSILPIGGTSFQHLRRDH